MQTTYSFPSMYLLPIIDHTQSYGLQIINLTLNEESDTYTFLLNNSVPVEEYSHLYESYNFNEIV
jgi:hypothetical protein